MTGRTVGPLALHRYCSGCSRETEHLLWPVGGPSHVPLIQWEGAEPTSGTTMCGACGERRVAAVRPTPVAWSSWPREPFVPDADQDGAPAQVEFLPEPEPSRRFALRRVRAARPRAGRTLASGGSR